RRRSGSRPRAERGRDERRGEARSRPRLRGAARGRSVSETRRRAAVRRDGAVGDHVRRSSRVRRVRPEESVRVAYIVSLFPKISETFVLREMEALRERGVEILVISLK